MQHIELDNDGGEYAPGDAISGKMRFRPPPGYQPKDTDRVRLLLHGSVEVRLGTTSQYSHLRTKDGNYEKRNRLVRSSIDYILDDPVVRKEDLFEWPFRGIVPKRKELALPFTTKIRVIEEKETPEADTDRVHRWTATGEANFNYWLTAKLVDASGQS